MINYLLNTTKNLPLWNCLEQTNVSWSVLELVFCSHGKLSEPELVLRVRPADNITLHCDCRKSSRNFIVWFRNCSHENQPSLILRTNYKYDPSYLEDKVDILNPFPRLHLVENQSSDSYDLLIMNTTDSDEGLYYCGTEQKEIDATFSQKYIYKYASTVTRHDIHKPQEDCGVCWKLLFTLCPFIVALFSLLSSVLFYQLRQKIGTCCICNFHLFQLNNFVLNFHPQFIVLLYLLCSIFDVKFVLSSVFCRK
uniref:Ig-like domain-containing protein n=1 Tax=Pundamilia nyererei TaxID=303518 RepID=A0A3B4GAA8_9CICH